jgi:hypothetical protein
LSSCDALDPGRNGGSLLAHRIRRHEAAQLYDAAAGLDVDLGAMYSVNPAT